MTVARCEAIRRDLSVRCELPAGHDELHYAKRCGQWIDADPSVPAWLAPGVRVPDQEIHVQEKRTASYECYPGAPCLTAAETGLLHGYTCPNHRDDEGWIGKGNA